MGFINHATLVGEIDEVHSDLSGVTQEKPNPSCFPLAFFCLWVSSLSPSPTLPSLSPSHTCAYHYCVLLYTQPARASPEVKWCPEPPDFCVTQSLWLTHKWLALRIINTGLHAAGIGWPILQHRSLRGKPRDRSQGESDPGASLPLPERGGGTLSPFLHFINMSCNVND